MSRHPQKPSVTATVKTMSPKQRQRAAELCRHLPLIQHELFTLGLVVTSAHMSKTIEKLGYECCLADLHANRITPDARRREDWMEKNGRAGELVRERQKSLRAAEKMLYGRAS